MPQATDRRGIVRWLLWSCLFWTAVGLFFAIQLRFAGLGWREALDWSLARSYSWGLLTPFIFLFDRWAVDRFALRWRVLLHVPLGVACTLAAILVRLAVRPLRGAPMPDDVFVFVAERAVPDLTFYVAIAFVSMVRAYANYMRARVSSAQDRAVALERRLAEAQLNNLKAQLQPHFLFNALNTISSLTESDPGLARRLMARLGDLLRVSLAHTSRPLVTLGEELTFLDDYLSIESARFEDRMSVSVDVDDDLVDVLVPSFLLQPLVENAIRHGLAPRLTGGRIDVSAKRANGSLILSARDDGVGLPPDWTPSRRGGIGIGNLHSRLTTLYGCGDLLSITNLVSGGVQATIEIPLAARGQAPDGSARVGGL